EFFRLERLRRFRAERFRETFQWRVILGQLISHPLCNTPFAKGIRRGFHALPVRMLRVTL
nr:hypothetical protein [Streptococcus anginosus]